MTKAASIDFDDPTLERHGNCQKCGTGLEPDEGMADFLALCHECHGRYVDAPGPWAPWTFHPFVKMLGLETVLVVRVP